MTICRRSALFCELPRQSVDLHRCRVEDLATKVETLRKAGAHFRNDIVIGNGGKQILLDYPAGNCIELSELLQK